MEKNYLVESAQLTLTGQELDDIRHAVSAAWFDSADDQQKSDRLNKLMDKLARASVLGHA